MARSNCAPTGQAAVALKLTYKNAHTDEADEIYINTIREFGIYDDIWQAFAVFLPIRTVGVQGDQRTHSFVIGLRAVTSADGMTADWFPFETDFLKEVSTRITNQVKEVNRVVLDVSSKPPSTIEWC